MAVLANTSSFSDAPPGGYPTGPETCGNRSDCEPVVRGFAEPLGLLAPVYAFCGALALTLALLLAANARRARRLRRGGSGGGRERLLPEEGELGGGATKRAGQPLDRFRFISGGA